MIQLLQRWKNNPIRLKFFSSFLAIVLFAGISMAVLNVQLLHVVEDNEKIVNHSVPKLVTLLQVKSNIMERINFVTLYVTTGNESFIHKFQEASQRAAKIEGNLLRDASPGEQGKVNQFVQRSQDWEFILEDRVIPVYQLGNKEGALALLNNEAQPKAASLMSEIEELSQGKTKEINSTNQATLANAWFSVRLSYLVIGGTLVLAIFFALFMSQNMTDPILSLLAAVRKMSKGDFSAHVKVRHQDELGELGEAFNQMSVSIQGLVGELTKANIRLKDETKRAQESTRLKSEFLANMSHELRTPLTGIIGYSELLLADTGGQLTDQQKDFAGNIVLAGEHLLTMINDILDLSKIEAGKYEIECSPVDIVELVQATIKIIPAQHHQIVVQYAEEPSWVYNLDETRIKQVLFNLVSNAIKFSNYGTRVTISLQQRGGYVTIEVMDQGIGIQSDKLDKIFEQFYQNDGSLGRKYEGTGLGLALSKQLVELHNGMITVESTPGEGSVFTVWLPGNDKSEERHAFTPASCDRNRMIFLYLPGLNQNISELHNFIQNKSIQAEIFMVKSKEDMVLKIGESIPDTVYLAGVDCNQVYLDWLEALRPYVAGQLIACLGGTLRLIDRGRVMQLADDLIPLTFQTGNLKENGHG
ncbi:ATP-binding protein [Aneurinibacillus sp. Ricciae_BoGa-3]|uniref:sensor histidine kinase n=1 Tax=Aneurinibacillus sp. Ricciae_BoGa-3 TaxID=3022697 RepID=UPI0023411007|nr:ATP-binding protein [Aneurinibacillus sp. Ricciae_BoGa-3]WCK55892.1 ATP-binding protein [Aneurinibacillus sp. Ricciae_BoGa-3]